MERAPECEKDHPVSRNVFSAPIGSPFQEDRERPRARTRGRVLVTGDNIPSHHFHPVTFLFLFFFADFTPPFYKATPDRRPRSAQGINTRSRSQRASPLIKKNHGTPRRLLIKIRVDSKISRINCFEEATTINLSADKQDR